MAANTDLRLTAEAWANIVIERWERKIERLGIGSTGALIRSFTQHVRSQADGRVDLIQFTFEYYGKFVDMGVGRGVKLDMVETSNRRAKPFLSKTFFSQLEKLKDILVDKYGKKAQITIVNEIETP